MFEKYLKRSSWADIIISLIFIVFGILVVAKPEATLGAMSILIGILFVAMGVLKLIEYYTSDPKEDLLLTFALISVIFGVVVLFAPGSVLAFFRIILGIWIIATGILDLQTILAWKEVKSPYWTLSLVFTLLMILAGIVILVNQEIVITAMGVLVIIYGVLDVIDRIIFMKKINDYLKD